MIKRLSLEREVSRRRQAELSAGKHVPGSPICGLKDIQRGLSAKVVVGLASSPKAKSRVCVYVRDDDLSS